MYDFLIGITYFYANSARFLLAETLVYQNAKSLMRNDRELARYHFSSIMPII